MTETPELPPSIVAGPSNRHTHQRGALLPFYKRSLVSKVSCLVFCLSSKRQDMTRGGRKVSAIQDSYRESTEAILRDHLIR